MKNDRALASGLVLAALACLSGPGARAEDDEDAAAKGRAMAEAKCARCHAIGLDDKSAHAAAPPFRVVIERYPSEYLAEALAEGIVSGHPDMPVFVLEPAEIDAFLAYLEGLREAQKSPPRAE